MGRAVRIPSFVDAEPTVAELREAMTFMAYIVEQFGEVYAPVLERLEREYQAALPRETPRERARRILQDHTLDGGLKAIR